jgi:hypothetical protein
MKTNEINWNDFADCVENEDGAADMLCDLLTECDPCPVCGYNYDCADCIGDAFDIDFDDLVDDDDADFDDLDG